MLQLHLKTSTAQFPEQLSELTPQQFYHVAQQYLLLQVGAIDFKAMQVQIVYALLNMRRNVSQEDEKVNYKLVRNIHYLCEVVKPWFKEEVKDGKTIYSLKLDFYDNPVPELTIDKRTYKGPTSLLTGLTFDQYIQAVNAYNDYSHTNDAHYLHVLITTMYKPVKHDYRFHLEDVDPVHQFMIFLFFAAVQQFLTTANHLELGGGSYVNIAQLFKPGKKKISGSNFGLTGALFELGKEGTFGNAQQTKEQEAWDVLVRMAQLHEQAIKLKKNAKVNRNKGATR